MEETGKIDKIYPIQENNGFKSQGFRLIKPHKDNPKYDKYPYFVCKSENAIQALSKVKVGQTVTVKFDLNSREWQDKVFGEAVAWAVNAEGQNNNYSNPSAPQATNDDDGDSLPF